MIIGFAAGSYGANRIEVSDFVSLESALISKLMKIPDEKGRKGFSLIQQRAITTLRKHVTRVAKEARPYIYIVYINSAAALGRTLFAFS